MGTAARGAREPRMSTQPWSPSVPIPPEEWQVLQVSRPNLLLTGRMADTAAALEALAPRFQAPTTSWQPGQPLVLPPVATPRTVILREVAALTPPQQEQLLEWLEKQGEGTQVVATTSLPLLPLAEGGAFDLRLYYHLNVIYVEPTA
jgi:hypothetical protein